jgi:glycerophosphoryl diester phosphodiesterase
MKSFIRFAAVLAFMCVSAPSVSGQLIIAHRGASHDAPENTMSAFRLAVEQGADGFEGDFFLTQDGQIICLHDKDTERVAGKKLPVTQTPFDELRKLDVGSWKGPQWKGEQMPTLAEVLAVVPPGKKFYIELKSSAEVVGPMVKVIASSGVPLDQLVVISFHEAAVAEAKRQLPEVKAYWLTDFKEQEDGSRKPTVDEVIATLKRSGADAVSGKAVTEHFNKAFIDRLYDAGYKEFHVWTVDDAEVARYYRDLGAASITTNRPGWLRERLARPE